MIGSIDEIQKLHIRTVPLGETPLRISYQESSQTFGVISTRTEIADPTGVNAAMGHPKQSASTSALNITKSGGAKGMAGQAGGSGEGSSFGDEVEVHSLLIIDQHTFEGMGLQ